MAEQTVFLRPADVGLADADYEVQVSLDAEGWADLPYMGLGQLALWEMAACDIGQPAELSLAFVGTEAMRSLNNEYRGIDKATDVLSFSASEPGEQAEPGRPLVLGDVIICPDIADRIQYGEDLDLTAKLELLVVHGILHLLGYDHASEADAQSMEAAEDRLLANWAQRDESLSRYLEAAPAVLTADVPRQESTAPRDTTPAPPPAAWADGAKDAEPAYSTGQGGLPSHADDAWQPDDDDSLGDHRRGGLVLAFRYAFEGLFATIKTQPNMRIHLIVAALACLAAVLLRLSSSEWAVLVVCIALVLSAEMLNTAIEQIVDLASPGIHPKAKLAKDIGAGVVLVFAICSVAAGLIVFIGALLRLLGNAG